MSKHHHDSSDDPKIRSAQPAEIRPEPNPAAQETGAQIVPIDSKEVSPSAEPQASDPCAACGDAAELEAAKGEIASLRAEVTDLNEKYLRKLADEVNFRKRMMREKEDAQKFAVAGLLGDIIPILDDFDRGLASSETAKNYEQLHEGVALIRKQLSQMLENKYSLKRFESKGNLFDPNRHEAVFAEPGDVEEAMVFEEYLPGYALHDRILRTAKVRVKIPAPQKPADSGQN
jgi:molecular chaperone GrpE